jgi:hypothetical protein
VCENFLLHNYFQKSKNVRKNRANFVFLRSLFYIVLVTVFLLLKNTFENVFIFAENSLNSLGDFRGYFSFFLTLALIGQAMKNERGVIGVLGPHLAVFTYIPYICTEVHTPLDSYYAIILYLNKHST